jgi:hypothetical protein
MSTADIGGESHQEVDDAESEAETEVVEYRNIIASAIMSVLVGGILLALGTIIVDDFLAIVPDDAFMNVADIGDPLTIAFGLVAILSSLKFVDALMDSFGDTLGGGGKRGGR